MGNIIAGIMIGLSSWIKVLVVNDIIGAVLFSLGLLTICYLDVSLFTGKAGAIELKTKDNVYLLLKIIGGNIFGVFVVSVIAVMGDYFTITEVCEDIAYQRLCSGYMSLFCRAIGCGILVDMAVNIFKNHNTTVAIFICVPAFILAGMPHCIADIFYYICGIRLISFRMILGWLATVIGNFIGCNIRRLLR